MNILFTLCGRAGSKGLKNKNLKIFLGIPLIYYSIAAVILYIKQYTGKDHIDVVLNTDSYELIKLVSRQNTQQIAVIERAAELRDDTVSKVDVIKDCIFHMEDRNKINYDIALDLDITSPLRTVTDVWNAIEKKKEREETIVVYSVTESRRNPYFNMVRKEGNYYTKAIASNYTSRQQTPDFFDMNASIYAYSAIAVKECKDTSIFFNGHCDAIMMKDTGILDIDSEEDFQLMEVVAKWLCENDKEFNIIFKTASELLL